MKLTDVPFPLVLSRPTDLFLAAEQRPGSPRRERHIIQGSLAGNRMKAENGPIEGLSGTMLHLSNVLTIHFGVNVWSIGQYLTSY